MSDETMPPPAVIKTAMRLDVDIGLARAIVAVIEERERQDRQWGGSKHDDEHEPDDFVRFIGDQIEKYETEVTDADASDARFISRMAKIAALAVAAIEMINRHHDRQGTKP